MSEQRIWTAPTTGLMKLVDIDQHRQAFLELLAKDAGVPEGVDAEFNGQCFTEVQQDDPSATTCHNEGDQTETEDG